MAEAHLEDEETKVCSSNQLTTKQIHSIAVMLIHIYRHKTSKTHRSKPFSWLAWAVCPVLYLPSSRSLPRNVVDRQSPILSLADDECLSVACPHAAGLLRALVAPCHVWAIFTLWFTFRKDNHGGNIWRQLLDCTIRSTSNPIFFLYIFCKYNTVWLVKCRRAAFEPGVSVW